MEELEFRISSGLKSIIGKELITNDLIAIFELVKNSYDANAKNVRIIFQNILEKNKKKGSRILIIDDGDGMSHDDLKEKFLFVGYSEKRDFEKELTSAKDFRDKIQKRRIFAGAKGIGRFSCDRLGTKLNLYTKKGKEIGIHHIFIDWQEFEEDQKKEFHIIKAKYSCLKTLKLDDYEIKNFKRGTILEISSLNDDWEMDKLIKLKRYLQRLINPAQVGQTGEFKIYLEVAEYLEQDKQYKKNNEEWNVINGLVKNVLFEKLGIKTTAITCSIEDKGERIFTELVDKGKFIFSIREKNKFPLLRDINVKLFYLNKGAKQTFTRTMGLEPVNFGSVFLYKNGIRIHPYGDEGDDWLGLEKRKGQGVWRTMSSRELMGRIEVNGYQTTLREVSSRDGGVVKTQEYDQLVEFFYFILKRLEKYVIEGLDWEKEDSVKTPEQIKIDSLEVIQKITGPVKDFEKEIKFNPDLIKNIKEKEIEKIPEVIKNLEKIAGYVKDSKEKDYIHSQLKAFRVSTRTLEKEKKEAEEDFKLEKKRSLFLTSIAGEDTKEIVSLNHQIGISTSNIDNHLRLLKGKIEKKEPITSELLVGIIEKIRLEIDKISTVVSIVTRANFNLMSETVEEPTDLVAFIRDYVKNVYLDVKKDTTEYNNVKIDVSSDNIEFLCEFKPLEIIIVLDNLLSNSNKANAKKIWIEMNKLNKDELELVLRDNGKGVTDKNLDKIFDFGFTTTSGSGIGLYHVKRIVDSMGGEISVNNKLKEGVEFRIIFKK